MKLYHSLKDSYAGTYIHSLLYLEIIRDLVFRWRMLKSTRNILIEKDDSDAAR
jgi:hypothetical protein